jgi:hypothetical protein
MLREAPAQAEPFNLDGYVFNGQIHAVGVVDAIMCPGTQAFMRHEAPTRLSSAVQARALDGARRSLAAVGVTHGLFSMEFFFDATSDRLTVIELNPRMASQYSDLYRRVLGVDLHAMAFALAHGRDPASARRSAPTAGAAASFVYRAFAPAERAHLPSATQTCDFTQACPDALLFPHPKSAGSIARDFKGLGSYRYGITHLGGRDPADLRTRCEAASALLGWRAPYAERAVPLADPVAGWTAVLAASAMPVAIAIAAAAASLKRQTPSPSIPADITSWPPPPLTSPVR